MIRGALDLLVEEVTEAAIANGEPLTREARQAFALDALVLLCQRHPDAYDAASASTASPVASAGQPAHYAAAEDAGAASVERSTRRKRRRNRGRNARYLGIIRIDLAQLLPDAANPGTGPMAEIAGVGRVPL